MIYICKCVKNNVDPFLQNNRKATCKYNTNSFPGWFDNNQCLFTLNFKIPAEPIISQKNIRKISLLTLDSYIDVLLIITVRVLPKCHLKSLQTNQKTSSTTQGYFNIWKEQMIIQRRALL